MLVHARCAVRPLLSLWGVMEREAWVGPRVAPIHIGVCVVRGPCPTRWGEPLTDLPSQRRRTWSGDKPLNVRHDGSHAGLPPAADQPKPTRGRLTRRDRTMLFAVSGLLGCPVKAGDGLVGSVKDFLFDDRSWKVRWMVVDTGHWLPGRQVLIHPSAIAPLDLALPVKRVLPMMTTGDTLVVSVRLTKEQIEASPDARQDEPVTKQMETDVYDHYGWDPAWGTTYFGASDIAAPLLEPLIFSENAARQAADRESHRSEGDPHLRSFVSVNGYHVHATDGDLGHVENFLADDVNWDIRFPGHQSRVAMTR